MTMTIVVSLLVAVVGALAYALAGSAKLAEMWRLAFFAGLFVFLFYLAPRVVHF